MIHYMELRVLRYVVTVADAGSIMAAADRLVDLYRQHGDIVRHLTAQFAMGSDNEMVCIVRVLAHGRREKDHGFCVLGAMQ